MISFPEFLLVLVIIGGIWYWINSMRAWEFARQTIRRRCSDIGVLLLDDTVVLVRKGLRRAENGRMTIFREYRFEFTSDARKRCKGEISLLGNRITHLEMEPYRDPDSL